MIDALTLSAPAKINIGLRIIGRKPDGFHLLHTVFAELAFGDTLSLTPTDDDKITLDVTGPRADNVPTDDSNLCLKAANLLKVETGYRGGAHIVLEKHIPPGSGLGGGSSDAATVLKGLNRLWDTSISNQFLEVIAGELGADVPYFIDGGVQFGEGIGDRLSTITMQSVPKVVVVIPETTISTQWAYGLFDDRTDFGEEPDYGNQMEMKQIPWGSFVNDFEDVIFPHHPELGEIKRRLLDQGALYAGLSGSGSALFGVFEEVPEELEIGGSHMVVRTQFV